MKKQILLATLFTALLLVSCAKRETCATVRLIPAADSVSVPGGSLDLNSLHTVSAPEQWEAVSSLFIKDVDSRLGKKLDFTHSGADIQISYRRDMAEEAYLLEVRKEKIVISASNERGVIHAFVTLQQLMMQADNGRIPLLTIQDKPRFEYRGVMLDCSRHFWTVAELKETIDQLSFFKLNVLHLHLTDNQAWRLAVDKYPDLVVKGTHYPDFPSLSGNHYSKKELKELVAYAALRGVEIIPEVDMPGHCLSLLAAVPELSCLDGPFEPYPDEREQDKRKRTWQNMLCIGNEKVYAVADDIIGELCDIFASPYIHMGGDEVATMNWAQCPKCKALFRKEGMKELSELQDYFTRKVSLMVRKRGRRMIGWDEINDRGAADKSDMLTVWQGNGHKRQRKAVEDSLSVIICPNDPCYFDYGYARNPTAKVYAWEPVSPDIAPDRTHLVKGGQACLWTEFVTTQSEVEHMLYPRLCALAEVLWVRQEKKDWASMIQRIKSFDNIFKALHIDYYAGESEQKRWFVPGDTLPPLAVPAKIETSMASIKQYPPEYAFDGDTLSFFATPYSLIKGDYFMVVTEQLRLIEDIRILCDMSKEYPTNADILISADGQEFRKVGSFTKEGKAEVKMEPSPVKAVKIVLTATHMARLSIREIILKESSVQKQQ